VEIIIFNGLIVVGVLLTTIAIVREYFLPGNAPANATLKYQKTLKNIQNLEHELGLCEHGEPHSIPWSVRARRRHAAGCGCRECWKHDEAEHKRKKQERELQKLIDRDNEQRYVVRDGFGQAVGALWDGRFHPLPPRASAQPEKIER
jgi:hypothetical protein